MLTLKQKQILDYIEKYINKNGYAPSFEEIRKYFKLTSRSTVHYYLEILKRKKYLNKQDNLARALEIIKKDTPPTLVNIPLLGLIAAGQPIEAIENKETIALPKDKVLKPREVYALRVTGNSMVDEGVNNGDIVLIKQQTTAENGQKVIALIDKQEATLKKYYKEKGHIRLQPANKDMQPIIINKNQEFDIQGIVLDVIKNINPIPKSTLTKKIEFKKTTPYFKTNNISIYKDDILKINSIPSNSIDLIVTSPPYNVDIHYNSHKDNLSYADYLEFTREWLTKCYNLAKDDGRFCLNIPLDKNKGGQQAVGADITKIAKDVGWRYHSTIIWNEGNISRRTAWGSYMSASAPYVISPVEIILVLYKNSWKKQGGSRENDITKQEFIDWTNGLWTFSGQSKKGAGGHPAPFPVELPRRCIKLFSFIGDTVLDPFLGSGSTLIAAKQNNRKGIGIDIDKNYCDIAISRLN